MVFNFGGKGYIVEMFGLSYKSRVNSILRKYFCYSAIGHQRPILNDIIEQSKLKGANEFDAAIMFMLVQLNSLSDLSKYSTQQFAKTQIENVRSVLSFAKTSRLEFDGLLDQISAKFEPPKEAPKNENPTSGLKFFRSIHRIDDSYLADFLGEATPSGEIKDEIQKMCGIVEPAIATLEFRAHTTGGHGSPHDEIMVGYIFGWLDVFKTHVWHVSDFNRSFYHYGFSLWFGNTEASLGGSHRSQNAMSAMLCLGRGLQSMTTQWETAAKNGMAEASAFLSEGTIPKGPNRQ